MSNLITIKSYMKNYDVEIYRKKESKKKRIEVLKNLSKNSFLVINKNPHITKKKTKGNI